MAFLNNLLTVDLTRLWQIEGTYGALLSPQGKILHDLFVVHHADEVFIDCAAVQAGDLMQKLKLYRLRAKIDIQRPDDLAVAVSPNADLGFMCYEDPRVASMGYRAIIQHGTIGAGIGYDIHRVQSGLGDSVADIGSGNMFVHEANLDQLNGVSFSKGCYVGQEVVSRTHHRHTARNRILPMRFAGSAAPGTDITSGETRIGSMLSSVDGDGLALVRLDRLAETAGPVFAGDVKLSVRKPDWATFELQIPEMAQ